MYKRILVPLDGSKVSEQVLPYVSTFAAALGSEVTLLRCIEPIAEDMADPAHGIFLDRVLESFLARAKEYLDSVSAPLRATGLKVTTMSHEGDPATKIVDEAAKDPSTLVAMSTHGRSGVTRWVLGSVANKVLQATDNPMLVVHPHETGTTTGKAKLPNMVVPLDGSKVAEQILPHATAIAKALAQKVVLVRVTPAPSDYYRYMEYPVGRYQDFSKEVDDLAQQYLQVMTEKLHAQGIQAVEHRMMHGQPAVAVIDVVKEVPQCLVAMTTHGRSGVGRWVLGSVADRVVRHSGAPVLLIRATEEN